MIADDFQISFVDYAANYNPNRGDAGSDHFGVMTISPSFREAYLRMWIKFEGDIPSTSSSTAGAHFWRFYGAAGSQIDMNMLMGTFMMGWYVDGDTEIYYNPKFQKNVWQEHIIRINLDTNTFTYTVDGQYLVNEVGKSYVSHGGTSSLNEWIFTNYTPGSGGDWLVDDVMLVTGPGASSYVDPNA